LYLKKYYFENSILSVTVVSALCHSRQQYSRYLITYCCRLSINNMSAGVRPNASWSNAPGQMPPIY